MLLVIAMKKTILILTAALGFPAVALATPVDLSSWAGTSGGTWQLQPGNNSVLQVANGNPTYFYEDGTNTQGQALSGTIKVTTSDDDDFIGFALGLESSDLATSRALPTTF
ncbi:MAG: hypothetical protein ACI8T1_001063 [Verrucomicrobiales bacterium]|jgi:hypothetical protein